MSNFVRCLFVPVLPRSLRALVPSPRVVAWSAPLLLGCGQHEILFVDGPMGTELQMGAMPNQPAPPASMAMPPASAPPVPAVMPPPIGAGSSPPIGSGSAPPPSAVPPSAVPPAAVPPSAVPPAAVPPAAPPEPCTVFGPFAEPEPITGLALNAQALGPAFSADGLTLFFSVLGEAADENIFSAQRAQRGAQFTPATPVPNLDANGSEEGTPFLSFDGLSLYFFSTRPGPGAQGSRDIWLAQRPTAAAPFEQPVVVPGVNGPDLEHLPRVSRDELSLFFVSSRDSANGATNLWMAQRASRSDEFAAPVEVPGINGDSREEGFSLSADGLTLFFASNRSDVEQMDLFVATRPDAAASFGAPEPLDLLNSAADDLDPQLSPDGLELFFASSRAGGFQLFRAARECDTL